MLTRFTFLPVLMLTMAVSLVVAPEYAGAAGIFYILVVVLLDSWFGQTATTPDGNAVLLDFLVWSTIPLHVFNMFYVLFHLPEFGRQFDLLMTALGVFNILIGIVIGHELIHKQGRLAFLAGEFCLAFSFHTSAAIDHVYSHHVNVGLPSDNVTARRGEGFWRYLIRVIPASNRFAWEFEKNRLANRNERLFSVNNRALVGHALSIGFLVLAASIAGWRGLVFVASCGLIGMVFIEAGNYIAHYGLVRCEAGRIAPRHSWNNFNLVSTSALFNLPRHSEHHLDARRHYWKLGAQSDVPCYPFGFAAMTGIAIWPALFFRVVEPELTRWTETLASDEERRIVHQLAGG